MQNVPNYNWTDYEKENNQLVYWDKINSFYLDVIEKFKMGNDHIYNPDIFKYLTKEKFFAWVIENNKDIAGIFS